jgi:hypothetical protein
MRLLDRRLRKIEEGSLPPAETAESRRLHAISSRHPAGACSKAWHTRERHRRSAAGLTCAPPWGHALADVTHTGYCLYEYLLI